MNVAAHKPAAAIVLMLRMSKAPFSKNDLSAKAREPMVFEIILSPLPERMMKRT